MIIMAHRSCQDDHVMIRKGELHLTESGWAKQCKDNDNENDNYIYTDFWIIQSVLMILMIRKGELHLTESVCPRDFLGELEYWGLSALHLGYIKRYKIIFSKFKYLRLAPRSYSPVEDNNNKVQKSSCSSTQFPQSHAALTRCRGPPGSSPLLTMGSIKRTR